MARKNGYFTNKFVQYFKRAKKDGVFTIARPDVEEFSDEDFIYIFNGYIAYRIAPALYEEIRPAAMIACPKPGEVVNLGNRNLTLESILDIWKKNTEHCNHPAVMTPFSFATKDSDVLDVFSISGDAGAIPVSVNDDFIAQLNYPNEVEWHGCNSISAVIGKIGDGIAECLYMPVKIRPEDESILTDIAMYYNYKSSNI